MRIWIDSVENGNYQKVVLNIALNLRVLEDIEVLACKMSHSTSQQVGSVGDAVSAKDQ